jgi:hypothetical protein
MGCKHETFIDSHCADCGQYMIDIIRTIQAELAIERVSRAFAWSAAARLARSNLALERKYLPAFCDEKGPTVP